MPVPVLGTLWLFIVQPGFVPQSQQIVAKTFASMFVVPACLKLITVTVGKCISLFQVPPDLPLLWPGQ
jgi:hypothetical protein